MPNKKYKMKNEKFNKISPSILSADFSRLGEEVKAVETAGADYIHVDVMDGHFVPNITIGPMIVESLRRMTSLPLDVHLMIQNPDNFLSAFIDAGADILTVHVEACVHLHRTLSEIKKRGARAGVSLNPATPLCLIESALEYADLVLVMTVNPGFGSQEFIPSVLPKVEQLRTLIDQKGWNLEVEVDGGIKVDNIGEVAKAGADVFVSGSGIFKTSDYGKTITAMREEVKKGAGRKAQGARR
ncbi:MAG: ribulose-phosphate 3-epimerase [Thermodesulfobacteriota bacterium]|nr:ribulose-phosphate 3-epimerase [Thermodesulfobacteriota bacterium]